MFEYGKWFSNNVLHISIGNAQVILAPIRFGFDSVFQKGGRQNLGTRVVYADRESSQRFSPRTVRGDFWAHLSVQRRLDKFQVLISLRAQCQIRIRAELRLC